MTRKRSVVEEWGWRAAIALIEAGVALAFAAAIVFNIGY